jgi:hypothetical protein
MNALIQRWASNGWKIKSLSEFHRTESGTGGSDVHAYAVYDNAIREERLTIRLPTGMSRH